MDFLRTSTDVHKLIEQVVRIRTLNIWIEKKFFVETENITEKLEITQLVGHKSLRSYISSV